MDDCQSTQPHLRWMPGTIPHFDQEQKRETAECRPAASRRYSRHRSRFEVGRHFVVQRKWSTLASRLPPTSAERRSAKCRQAKVTAATVPSRTRLRLAGRRSRSSLAAITPRATAIVLGLCPRWKTERCRITRGCDIAPSGGSSNALCHLGRWCLAEICQPTTLGETMSKEAHTKAAEHHDNAAKAHRSAADAHSKNDHAKAKEYATQAQTHSKSAREHSEEAHKQSHTK